MKKKNTCGTLLVLCYFSVFGLPSGAGTLDTMFNKYGIQPGTNSTFIDNVLNNSEGYGIALQADGKIVIVGLVTEGGINKFAVARFKTNGEIDTTFNVIGTASTTIDSLTNESEAYGVAIQTDGKIVVSGYVVVGGLNRFAVARFNTNGLLDTTFNAGGTLPGTVSTAIDNAANDSSGFAVALQTDGKIVIMGNVFQGGISRVGLARFNINGILDTTFNVGGTLPGTVSTAIDNPANDSFGGTPLLQSDGKIISDAGVIVAGINKIAAVRFNSNGTIDTTFNSGGPLPGTVSTFVDAIGNDSVDGSYKAAIQADGKLVIAGWVTVLSTRKLAVVRFNTNGSLDTSFNITGTLPGTLSIPIGTDAFGSGVALQTDGKIVISGVSTAAGVTEFTVVRLTSAGALDTSFNTAGSQPGVTTTTIDNQSIPGGSGTIANVSLQTDGRIVIAGYIGNALSRFAVARFLGSTTNICTA